MKRLICCLLAFLLLLCGCGEDSTSSTNATTTITSTTTSSHLSTNKTESTIRSEVTPLPSATQSTQTSNITTTTAPSSSVTVGNSTNDASVSATTSPSASGTSSGIATSTVSVATSTVLPTTSTTSATITTTATQNTSSTKTTGTSSTTQTKPTSSTCSHTDANDDGNCDVCATSVLVYFDFYSINDLHGKFANTQDNIGVDELTTYLKNANEMDENTIFLSTGDMWQGSAESNMTKGKIVVDWMNELDFSAMTIGNHEFDWGEEYIASNAEFATFPFVAINVYDRKTNALVDFCEPSVMVERGGMQIGIIGAAGDNYSSIAVDKCDEVYFKTGRELTNLVKAESDRLRSQGADFIVYLLHDGYGESNSSNVSVPQISSYYDVSLSNGYIDLVFEGHTHQSYRFQDPYGVYHMQNRGDNKGGISHAEIAINAVTMTKSVRVAELVTTYFYQDLEADPIVDNLLAKYADSISPADRVLGYNNRYRGSSELLQIVAQLYYEVGVETWGDQYNIVLGGGFMSARSPYNLYAGEVTYGKLQTILPFDNQLTLCSVSGYNLRRKFLETTNDRYYIYCGEYGNSIRYDIDPNATYYIITDSYSAYYAPNQLTVLEKYDPNIFARDLLADYIEEGNFT